MTVVFSEGMQHIPIPCVFTLLSAFLLHYQVLDDAVMYKLAAEMNLSETAFVAELPGQG